MTVPVLGGAGEGAGEGAPHVEAGVNVLGGVLKPCSQVGSGPRTGFYRDGCCTSGRDDTGRHVVCASMTAEFLEFAASVGNDLATPQPSFGFPGLRPGDHWCLCAERWQEAFQAGVAPPVYLEATHQVNHLLFFFPFAFFGSVDKHFWLHLVEQCLTEHN